MIEPIAHAIPTATKYLNVFMTHLISAFPDATLQFLETSRLFDERAFSLYTLFSVNGTDQTLVVWEVNKTFSYIGSFENPEAARLQIKHLEEINSKTGLYSWPVRGE